MRLVIDGNVNVVNERPLDRLIKRTVTEIDIQSILGVFICLGSMLACLSLDSKFYYYATAEVNLEASCSFVLERLVFSNEYADDLLRIKRFHTFFTR
jgi:hypothetical protein